jgi:hypothetical protein
MKRSKLPVPLILIAVATGCGGNTATVSGKVTYHGRPVTSGSVIVLNDDGTAKPWVILPDSSYTVAGVKRGHVKFGVYSPDPSRARSILTKRDPAKRRNAGARVASPGWFPLPKTLGDPDKSGLECDVLASSVHHDLDLK